MADGIAEAQKQFADILKELERLRSKSALTTEDIPTPKVLTTEQAVDFGIDIGMPADWFMEVMPSPAGVEPEIKFIAPDQKVYSPSDIAVSEEGIWMPVTQYERESYDKQQRILQTFRSLYPESFADVMPENYIDIANEKIAGFEQPESFANFLANIYERGQSQETIELLQFVMPEITYKDLADFFTGRGGIFEIPSMLVRAIPDKVAWNNVDDMITFYNENPSQLYQDLRVQDWNEANDRLIRYLQPDWSDKDINTFFTGNFWKFCHTATTMASNVSSGIGRLSSFNASM